MSAPFPRTDQGNALNALAGVARRTSDAALVAFETAGIALALAICAWIPERWPFILPCLALAAYGLWGLCDHFIQSRSGRRYKIHRQVLRWVARAIAAAGIAAAIGGAYLLMGWLMGVYIS